MVAQNFGKFASVDAFLEHHARTREHAMAVAGHGMSFEELVEQRRQQPQAVVEVAATLKQREPDDLAGGEHIRLLITLTRLIQGSPSVNADIERVLTDGEDVFVAIRIGGSEGISQPIQGLVVGVGLDLKGVWIPRSQAYSEGGESVSVLHYTHSPVGFICVDQPPACYQ